VGVGVSVYVGVVWVLVWVGGCVHGCGVVWV